MVRINMEHPNFRADDFARDFFEGDKRDPFVHKLQNIRNWDDVRNHFGLSYLRCDPYKIRQGYVSEPLYQHLADKIGKEQLDTYFTDSDAHQMPDEWEQMATLILGNVSEVNALRSRIKK